MTQQTNEYLLRVTKASASRLHFSACILLVNVVGNTVKLRGHPKAFITKPLWKQSGGRAKSSGYGQITEGCYNGQSAAKS